MKGNDMFYATALPNVFRYMDTGSGGGLTLAELKKLGMPTAGGAPVTEGNLGNLTPGASVLVRDRNAVNE